MSKKRRLEPIAALRQTAPTKPKAQQGAATPFDHGQVPAPIVQPFVAPPSSSASPILQLLWVDESIQPRLRRQPSWRALVDALGDDDDLDLEEALKRTTEHDPDTARSAFEILSRAHMTSADSLRTVLSEAVRADGKLSPPLVLLRDVLELRVDRNTRLALAMEIVEPLAGASAELAATLEAMAPYVGRPQAVVGGADALFQQLISAVRGHVPSLPSDHVERTVARALVEQRSFLRRDVFGAPHALAQLGSVPAYLTEEAARALPLCQQTQVRVLAEVHPRIDEAESHGVALRFRALAREVDRASL